MKTSIRLTYAILLILAVTGISSCNKDKSENGIGTAEFSLNLPDGLSQLKSVTTDDLIVSYQIMVSVADMKGNSVLTDKLIPLYTFGTGFVSEKIEIKTGEFRLTKFLVINPTGAIVYATPMAGSSLAYLTKKPLPMTINIFPDKVTSVLPEVLVVGDQSPSQFGYATFGVQIIKPLAFYTKCILDNPSIDASTPTTTTAKLTISDNSGWIYSFKLIAGVNHLNIRGGSEKYFFLLEKEGYASRKMEFTATQLLETKQENPLVLKIPVGTSTTQILSLQPGSEGKDAMISKLEADKNFGANKYFEATYMTEPVLTVMRSNRSLISFNMSALPKSAIIKKVVLKLTYDLPIPWDNSIFVSDNSGNTVIKPVGLLQQIIEPWEENTVTWNKAPKTTELNQVFIEPFIRNVNFIEVDVTRLFVSTATNILPNYGILFKLNQDNKFKGFRFASSDFTEPSMRPRLSVHYTIGK